MKYRFAVGVLSTVAAFCLAGCTDPASPNEPPRWEITIGGAGNDIPYDVARLGERFVVVGSSEAAGGQSGSIFVAVVDGDGSLLADTLIETDSPSSANTVVPLASDRFAVGGHIGGQALIMEMDLSLDVDKILVFDPPDEYSSLSINAMAISIADGYIIGGTHTYSQRPMPPTSSSWLAYVGAGDTLVNSHFLPGKGIVALEFAYDGTYAFVYSNQASTWFCEPGEPCNVSDICIGRCNEVADTIWMKSIPGPDAEGAGDVCPNPGNLLVAGDNGPDIWLGAFDDNGTEQNSKAIVDTNGYTWANDIDLGPGATYILCGGIQPNDASAVDAILLKLDYNADVIWKKQFGGDMHDEAIVVLPLAFGYLILGQTYSYGAGGSDFWLIRTDLDGRIE